MDRLGLKLIEIMKRQKLSAYRVSKLTGGDVDYTHLGKYLSGKAKLTTSKLDRIIESLNLTFDIRPIGQPSYAATEKPIYQNIKQRNQGIRSLIVEIEMPADKLARAMDGKIPYARIGEFINSGKNLTSDELDAIDEHLNKTILGRNISLLKSAKKLSRVKSH